MSGLVVAAVIVWWLAVGGWRNEVVISVVAWVRAYAMLIVGHFTLKFAVECTERAASILRVTLIA